MKKKTRIKFEVPDDFNIKKIQEEADKFNSVQQQIEYLEYVLKELELRHLQNPYELAEKIYFSWWQEFSWRKVNYEGGLKEAAESKLKEINEFYKVRNDEKNVYEKKREQIEIELEYRKKQLAQTDQAVGKAKIPDDKITPIKIGSTKTDVVRIFEAMLDAEIVDSKTPIKDIISLFFNDFGDREDLYSAIKKQARTSGSRSEKLVEFIKILCKSSFEGDRERLENLERYMSKLNNLADDRDY